MTSRLRECPQCGVRIYRTHRCLASATRPSVLVPIPTDFRDQVRQAQLEQRQQPLPIEEQDR